MALLKSTIALFPDLPICWDEGRVKGRIWCPLNPLGEPEATWREWPINPDHPIIPGEGTVFPFDTVANGDSALPQWVHEDHRTLAEDGLLFNQTVAMYNHNQLCVASNSGPAFRLCGGTFGGIAPFREQMRLISRSGVVVPPVLPRTTVSVGTGWGPATGLEGLGGSEGDERYWVGEAMMAEFVDLEGDEEEVVLVGMGGVDDPMDVDK